MTSIITQVKGLLEQVGKGFGIEGQISLDFPADFSFGDLTTNVAMMYAKQLGRNPKELAEAICEEVRKTPSFRGGDERGFASESGECLISEISVAGPGFINIKLTEKALLEARSWVVSTSSITGYNSHTHEGKKILVEHSSLNLFKPFHVGHLMNNTIGESLTRLMKSSGANVATCSFPSDVSLGIAKAIYALLYSDELKDAPENVTTAGRSYVIGTRLYEESEEIQKETKRIAELLFSKQENTKEYQVFKKFSDISRDYLFYSLKELTGTEIHDFIYESESGVQGIETINKFISTEEKQSVFTKSEGAIVYIPHEDRKDINTAVFINSQGNPTYEAKDIGLIDLKFERYNPDLSIFITDHEQVSHFKVVLAAYADIENELTKQNEGKSEQEKIEVKNAAEKSIHIYHGRMQFKGQKMSSRLGGVPTAEEIISAVKEEVIERLRDEQKQDDKLASDIAIGAIKFAILRSKPGSNINFDPETSLSFEGDSGPYLMYTHARICSLLEKATTPPNPLSYKGERELPFLHRKGLGDGEIPKNWKSLPIESLLMQFPVVVEKAQLDYAPHYMVTYLLQLAQEFNSWYGNTKMIDTDEQAPYRLAICNDVKTTLKEGMWMLGMNAPEKM